MDFKDWRKTQEKVPAQADAPTNNKYSGRKYEDYVSEQIREAMERGDFDNLPGFGKPLNLNGNAFAGDKEMGYHLLKSNGYVPKEIELAKEIRTEFEQAEAKVARLQQRSQMLRTRRVPPFPSEKRAYNMAVEKGIVEYERTLRELNRKILTLNLSAPSPMHRPMFEVEKLVQQFRDSCPLFA
jgi:DnaJ homolog subfamily C member 28